MNQENTPKTPAQLAHENFFTQTGILVSVSYPALGLIGSMEFDLRPVMQTELKLANQDFYALDESEQETARAAHNLQMVSGLLMSEPRNVPGYPAPVDGETTADRARRFFGDGNELKEKVISDVLNLYFKRLNPLELFRTV